MVGVIDHVVNDECSECTEIKARKRKRVVALLGRCARACTVLADVPNGRTEFSTVIKDFEKHVVVEVVGKVVGDLESTLSGITGMSRARDADTPRHLYNSHDFRGLCYESIGDCKAEHSEPSEMSVGGKESGDESVIPVLTWATVVTRLSFLSRGTTQPHLRSQFLPLSPPLTLTRKSRGYKQVAILLSPANAASGREATWPADRSTTLNSVLVQASLLL